MRIQKPTLPLNQRIPLPEPSVFRSLLCSKFSAIAKQPILLVDGVGENWKRQKLGSVILTAIPADIRTLLIKTFHRVLLLREIASEYSVNSWIYILTLRDRIDADRKGLDKGAIEDKIKEAQQFLEEIFKARGIPVDTKEDETYSPRVVPPIREFEASMGEILKQMRSPSELENTHSFGEKRTVLTSTEKRLLKIYLFERRMLEILNSQDRLPIESSARYSFISWGLVAQTELNVSYNVYDESNAGAAILRKLVSIENSKEYPGTIVLPDPLKISGGPMRYQVQRRDLGGEEALFVSDSYADAKRKLVDQAGVSNEFLNYLAGTVMGPFLSSSALKEIDSLTDVKTQASFARKQQLVLKHYWRFIKPYYGLAERITCQREGLFVTEEFQAAAFDALGCQRNRTILQKIASFKHDRKCDVTIEELRLEMGLEKSKIRSLYRNLNRLERSGLVESSPEGRLRKYRITGDATRIILKWNLVKEG